MSSFADTPAPPYYAVVFTSRLTGIDDDAYSETAAAMEALAATMPGYLGIESARGADGLGITVSYWESEAAIANWRAAAAHRAAREKGNSTWYARYELRVAKVERAYGGPPGAGVGE